MNWLRCPKEPFLFNGKKKKNVIPNPGCSVSSLRLAALYELDA